MSDPVRADPARGAGSTGLDDDDAAPRAPQPSPSHWWLLLGVALVVYAVVADAVGTVVVLPDLGDDLRASSAAIVWVLAAFAVGFTGPYLWFVRRRERGRLVAVTVSGALVFALGALVAAPAQDIWWLVGGRGIQGLGAASFAAGATVLVRRVFHDDHEAQAMWLLGGAAAVAAVVGPVTAGALAEEIGWRMIYLTGLPVIVLGAWMVAVVAVPLAPDAADPDAADPDPAAAESDGAAEGRSIGPSVVLLTVGVVAAVVALVHGRGGLVQVAVSLVAFVVAIVTLRTYWRRDTDVGDPLMDLDGWRRAPARGLLVASLLTAASLGGSLLMAVLLAQLVVGERPIGFGLALAVFGIAAVVTAGVAEVLVVRASVAVPVAAGAVVTALGSIVLSRLGPESTLSDVVVGMAALGVGSGLVVSASSLAAVRGAVLDGVARHLVVARAIGFALGVGIATFVLKLVENRRLDDFVTASGASLPPSGWEEVTGLLSSAPYSLAALKRLLPGVVGEVNSVAREATAAGSSAALVVCAALALGGAVVVVVSGPRGGPVPDDDHPDEGHPADDLPAPRAR